MLNPDFCKLLTLSLSDDILYIDVWICKQIVSIISVALAVLTLLRLCFCIRTVFPWTATFIWGISDDTNCKCYDVNASYYHRSVVLFMSLICHWCYSVKKIKQIYYQIQQVILRWPPIKLAQMVLLVHITRLLCQKVFKTQISMTFSLTTRPAEFSFKCSDSRGLLLCPFVKNSPA